MPRPHRSRPPTARRPGGGTRPRPARRAPAQGAVRRPCRRSRSLGPWLARRRSGARDTRIKGHSYPQAGYEDAIGAILAEIGRVDDATISEIVRIHGAYRPRADELTLARIARARDDAGRHLAKTRDVAAWQATMARLDAEERIAREPVETRRHTPPEIVDYTRSLPRLWAHAGPDGRQALVLAIFARLDVLGFQSGRVTGVRSALTSS